MRRLLSLLAPLLLLTSVGPAHHESAAAAAPRAAAAQTWTLSAADEDAYVAHINAIRQAKGLNALRVHDDMRRAARDWTVWMAEHETLQHADDIVTGVPSDWTKAGENVGRGATVDSVWEAFLASPAHADNVLDPDYDYVGVGVVWTAGGKLYTTHRFASTESGAPKKKPKPEPPAAATPEEATASEQADPDGAAPAPSAPADPSPAPPAPEQLPFAPVSSVPPPAEPERVAVTMALLLLAGS